MTGVLATLLGSANVNRFTVTVGEYYPNEFQTWYGFYKAAFGTITPSQWRGVDVNYLFYNDINSSVNFQINTVSTQGVFTRLVTAGQTFNSADASYSTPGGASTWTWYTATNPFPTNGANVPVDLFS